jgi:hypothetical protein
MKFCEADENPLLIDPAVERQTQSVEQRQDHDCRIDQHGGCQENGNMPAYAGAFHAASGSDPGSVMATRILFRKGQAYWCGAYQLVRPS